MRCEDVHAHLADHLAGALAPPAAEDVAAHLRTCPACAAEADGLTDTWQMLGTLAGDRPDSTALRSRFHAALDAQIALAPDSTVRRPSSAVRTYLLQFAAAAAILVLGVALGRESRPAATVDPQIALLREELRDMRQMVTLSLLQQQSASERLKGVTWTGQIEQPGSEVTAALLDTLMHDPSVNVRLASIDALERFAERDAVRRGALAALPRQTSPLVQLALIDFVVETNGREAAETLRHLSTDPMLDAAVRARAAAGLQQIG